MDPVPASAATVRVYDRGGTLEFQWQIEPNLPDDEQEAVLFDVAEKLGAVQDDIEEISGVFRDFALHGPREIMRFSGTGEHVCLDRSAALDDLEFEAMLGKTLDAMRREYQRVGKRLDVLDE